MRTVLFILLTAASGGAAAQTYKWVDERGVVNYGEKPPVGKVAKPVDTRPGGTIESAGVQKPEGVPATEVPAVQVAAPQPVPTAAPRRGMDFDTYTSACRQG